MSWVQGALVLFAGIALVALSLTSGVQDASSRWRLRAISIGAFISDAPHEVLRFSSLLPFAGFSITMFGLGLIVSRGLIRSTLKKAAIAVTGLVVFFQVGAYVAAASWFHSENQAALRRCDYCSMPHPRLFEWPYAITSSVLVLLLLILLLLNRERASRRRSS